MTRWSMSFCSRIRPEGASTATMRKLLTRPTELFAKFSTQIMSQKEKKVNEGFCESIGKIAFVILIFLRIYHIDNIIQNDSRPLRLLQLHLGSSLPRFPNPCQFRPVSLVRLPPTGSTQPRYMLPAMLPGRMVPLSLLLQLSSLLTLSPCPYFSFHFTYALLFLLFFSPSLCLYA